MSDYLDCRLRLGSDKFSCRSGRWTDHSRWHNHGTPKNGAKPWMIIPGQLWSYRFNGVDGYVDLPTLPLSAAGDFTIEAWINRASLTSDEITETVVSLEESVGYCRLDWYNSDDTIFGYFYDGSNHHHVGATVISANTWYHVVYTKSGSNFALYVNRILKGTDTGSIVGGTGIEAIGSRLVAGTNEYKWNGHIGEVHTYGRARTAKEAKEDYYKSPLYLLKRGIIRR